MGLKKIFSSSNKQDNLSPLTNTRHNSSKSSSLSQSISNWTHKEKEKLKHHSTGSSNRLSVSSISSSTQPPAPLPPTIEVLEHEPLTINLPQEENTNPFLTKDSPTDSMKDVTDVVNVLRDSLHSNTSLSTTLSEDEKHTQFNRVADVPTPIEEEEPDTNPFFTKENQIYASPTDSTFDNHDLYTELLCVQKQLESINPENTMEMKSHLEKINNALAKAMTGSSKLEKRIESIVSASKTKMTQQNQEIIQLKQAQESAQRENEELQSKSTQLATQLDQLSATQNSISVLLKDDENTDLQAKVRNLVVASAAANQLKIELEKKLQDTETQHRGLQEEFDRKHEAYQQLEQQTTDMQQQQKEFENQLQSTKDQQQQAFDQELEQLQKDLLVKFELQREQELNDHEQQWKARESKLELQRKQQQEELESKFDQEKKEIESKWTQEKEIYESKLAQQREELEGERKTREQQKEAYESKLVEELEHQSAGFEAEKEKMQKEWEQEKEEILKENRETWTRQSEEEKKKALDECEAKYEDQIQLLASQHEQALKSVEEKGAQDLKAVQDTYKQQNQSYDTRIEALAKELEVEKSKFDTYVTRINTLQEENGHLKQQIDILKNSTTDDVQKIAEENMTLLQKVEQLEREKEASAEQMQQLEQTQHATQKQHEEALADLESQKATADKEHVAAFAALTAEMSVLKDNLIKVQNENLALHSKVSELQTSDKVLNDRLVKLQEQSEASMQKVLEDARKTATELEAKIEAAEADKKQLEKQLVEMEQVSKEAAKSVLDENERLENRVRELEEDANRTTNEKVALNEEIELLNAKTSKKSIVNENVQLKSQLKAMNNVRQENESLTEMVSILQTQLKDLSEGKIVKKAQDNRQEELMQMHTRAQLSLIEYLEGEDNVSLAMTKFKKQLETEMKEFSSPANHFNENIASIATSTRMR